MKLPKLILLLLLLPAASGLAQEFVWAPEFPVGSEIPVLAAPDQNGNTRTLDTLSGEKGLMLFFSRSFDWCPFCKAQLADIVEIQDEMESLGFNIASMTYDSQELQKQAEQDFGVGFTMLQDIDIKHVNAFGILNTEQQPGSFGYGIPQPGIMLISPDGVILHKFAEESYRDRPILAEVLEAASKI